MRAYVLEIAYAVLQRRGLGRIEMGGDRGEVETGGLCDFLRWPWPLGRRSWGPHRENSEVHLSANVEEG